MWEPDRKAPLTRGASRPGERGAAAVEFALVAILFFTIIFGIIEVARVIYMHNTLAEVTRSAAREAAYIDWGNSTKINEARRKAVFDPASGQLPFGNPITYQHIRLEYLYLERQGNGALTMKPVASASMPSCPAQNKHNCLVNPYGNNCIRLVRARICQTGNTGECTPVPYVSLTGLVNFLGLKLPTSTTIVNAESLGYKGGDPIEVCLP